MKRHLVRAIDHIGNRALAPPRSGFGRYRLNGPRGARRIALTYDDGPSMGSTEILLDTLLNLDVKATFFCIGAQVKANPALVDRMVAEGHTIGNHSYAHRRMAGLRPGHDSDEHIVEAARQIERVVGRLPRLYRPPWGWLTPWEGRRLDRLQFIPIGWDIMSSDWSVPEIPGAVLASDVLRRVQPGSIVVMHDSRSLLEQSDKVEHAVATEAIVAALATEGMEFVTVDELLGIDAYLDV